jgi:hypothetical protein
MRSYLLKFSGKIQVTLVVGLTIAIAFIVASVCKQFFDLQILKSNADLISSVYQVLGTVYAILLTFTLWGVWQNYTEAENAVEKEAYALLDLVHVIESSTRWAQYNIREAALTYSEMVVTQEWSKLKNISSSTINLHEHGFSTCTPIVTAIQNIIPEGDREVAIFAQTLRLLNSWQDARRTRLLIARGNCAESLWPVLFTGAFVLFAFHGLFVAQTFGIWATLLGGFSLVIGLTFYLIFTLDCPFGGYPSIDAEPFYLAIHLLKSKKESA